MSFCTECGGDLSDTARFCPGCGAAVDGGRPAPATRSGWLTLDDVLGDVDRRYGAIGGGVAALGAFTPWGYSHHLFGLATTGTTSPLAWLAALAAVGALVMLFRERSATVVMVAGIVAAAIAALFVLTTAQGGSLSWGVLLTLAGGGLMTYSGHRGRQHEAW